MLRSFATHEVSNCTAEPGQTIKLSQEISFPDVFTYELDKPVQYDLDLMEDMGANAVRTAHYPNDELFLDLCDCRVSEEWFFARPRDRNNKGVVDEYRRPKLSYAAVRNIFRSQK